MRCPECGSNDRVKNGYTNTAKRTKRFKCKGCSKIFTVASDGCHCHLLRTPLDVVARAVRLAARGADLTSVARIIKKPPKTLREWLKKARAHTCQHCNWML